MQTQQKEFYKFHVFDSLNYKGMCQHMVIKIFMSLIIYVLSTHNSTGLIKCCLCSTLFFNECFFSIFKDFKLHAFYVHTCICI